MDKRYYSIPYRGILIAGVDEAGRGPLAGPVFAAAVILNPDKPILGLTDSKKLNDKKRRYLMSLIEEHALAYAYGRAEVAEIDQINILQASLLAMQRAVLGLALAPEYVIVDGNFPPKLPYPCQAIVQGDLYEPAISAASILAKVARDNEMIGLDQQFPGYGLAEHKGYPTKSHVAALHQKGASTIHRRSFAPVRLVLENESL